MERRAGGDTVGVVMSQPPGPPVDDLSGSAMEIGLLFANNRDNVADVTLHFKDGAVSSGWYASRVQFGADVVVTLSHHPSATGPVRADHVLDLRALVGMQVALSDGADHRFGCISEPSGRGGQVSEDSPIAPLLLDFANRRISFSVLARWLAEHRALWVPAVPVEGGGHRPYLANEGNASCAFVFTSERTHRAWVEHLGPSAPRTVMNETWGSGFFGDMPGVVTRIDIDAASAFTVQVRGEPLGELRTVSRAVTVERALSTPGDAASRERVLDHVFGMAMQAAGPGQKRALAVPVPTGEQLLVVFTARDCVDAFFANAGPDAGLTPGSLLGRDLFASLEFLGVTGVSVNPAGPGARHTLAEAAIAPLLSSAAPAVAQVAAGPPATKNRRKTCVLCGAQCEYAARDAPPTRDTLASGLDGRPSYAVAPGPGDSRLALDATLLSNELGLEECGECGHLAPDVSVPYPTHAESADTRAELYGLTGHDRATLRYLAVAQLFGEQDPHAQGMWVLRAAWADEAAHYMAMGVRLRRRAASLLESALSQGLSFVPRPGGSSLALSEIFRVGGQLAKALEHCRRGLAIASVSDEDAELLLYEGHCILEAHTAPLSCGEARDGLRALGGDAPDDIRRRVTERCPSLAPIHLTTRRAFSYPAPQEPSQSPDAAVLFAKEFLDASLMRTFVREGRAGVWEAIAERPVLLAPLLRLLGDLDRPTRAGALTTLRGKSFTARDAQGTFELAGSALAQHRDAFEAVLARLQDDDAETVRAAATTLKGIVVLEPSYATAALEAAERATQLWPGDVETLQALAVVRPGPPPDPAADWPTFERSLALLTDAKEVDRALRRALLSIARWSSPTIGGRNKEDVEVETWTRLGTCYRDRLGNVKNAIEAFEMVAKLRPRDASVHFELAKLHEHTEGPARAMRCIEAGLACEPSRIDGYRSLFGIHLRARADDAAWCAASVLAHLKAPGAEAEFYRRHRPRRLPTRTTRLDETSWLLLRHPDEGDLVGNVFHAIAPAAEKLARARRGSLLEPAARFGPPVTKHPLFASAFAHAARTLGLMSSAHLGQQAMPSAEAPHDLVPLDAFHDGHTTRELLFVAGHQAAYHRSSHLTLFAYHERARDLVELFTAAVRVGWREAWGVPPRVEPHVGQMASELVRVLSPAELERLRIAVRGVAREGGVSIHAWIRASELTAIRAGLLVSGDVAAADRAIRALPPINFGADVPEQARLDELLVFAASENHVALRKTIGSAIDVSVTAPTESDTGASALECVLEVELTALLERVFAEPLPDAAALRELYVSRGAYKITDAGPNLDRPPWASAVGADNLFVHIERGDISGVRLWDDPRGWGTYAEVALARGDQAEVEKVLTTHFKEPLSNPPPIPYAPRMLMTQTTVGGRTVRVILKIVGGSVKHFTVHVARALV
jgi:tetratricopeptide (TPR) repeat protein